MPPSSVLGTGRSRNAPFSERAVLGTGHFSERAILRTGHSPNGPFCRTGRLRRAAEIPETVGKPLGTRREDVPETRAADIVPPVSGLGGGW